MSVAGAWEKGQQAGGQKHSLDAAGGRGGGGWGQGRVLWPESELGQDPSLTQPQR